MKEKSQRFFLIGITIVILVTFTGFLYILLTFIPNYSTQLFGAPNSALDNSHRIILSFKLFLNRDSLLLPNSTSGKESLFVINPDDPAEKIAENLAKKKFIKDTETFKNYLTYKGIDHFLRSGSYQLTPTMTPIEIAAVIYDTNPEDVAFSFLAGWRSEEIASLLPTSGLSITPENFLNIVNNPSDQLSNQIPTKVLSLEGFLSPGNYQVSRLASSEQLINEIITSFSSRLPKDYKDSLKKTGLSLYQTIILASIIEKEKILSEEATIISSVFINRLHADMPLQSDPTVQYAIGFDNNLKTWWKNPLSSNDLKLDSPFNTYLYQGLPPTPICNPSTTSILAALNPAKTDFLFFRAACDGSGKHVFNSSFEDHLKAACK